MACTLPVESTLTEHVYDIELVFEETHCQGVVPLEIEGSDKSHSHDLCCIHYTLIVVNNPEFSQKIMAEGINKNDFVSHIPPK